jgi:hypothetical protein
MKHHWKRVRPGEYGFVIMEENPIIEIHCMAARKYGKWRWATLAIFRFATLAANVSLGEYVDTKAEAQALAIEAIPVVRGMMNKLRGLPEPPQ